MLKTAKKTLLPDRKAGERVRTLKHTWDTGMQQNMIAPRQLSFSVGGK
jgi:hypothetical protein